MPVLMEGSGLVKTKQALSYQRDYSGKQIDVIPAICYDFVGKVTIAEAA